MRKQSFARNLQAGTHIDTWMVLAVLTVLVIRTYLHLTGYPQVGGDTLHIAHMLWGGLLMMVALTITFSFLSRPARHLAVILAGIGFGLFIDEVGKFLTKDNDYFFQPAIAVMYTVFMLIYLSVRAIQSGTFTPTEYLMNALKEVEEYARNDLDESEKERALAYLKKSDPKHPLTRKLREILTHADLVSTPRATQWNRARKALAAFYLRLTRHPWFARGVIAFFVAELVIRVGNILILIFLKGLGWESLVDRRVIGHVAERMQNLTFLDKAELTTSAISVVFTALGVWWVRRSRLRAYRYFRSSVLINLLLTQVFLFAREQFNALLGLTGALLLYIALNYLIDQERLDQEERGDPAPSG